MGVLGYFTQKRRGADGDVRGFLVWYALGWPFMACVLTAGLYPRWHWLYIVAGLMAAGNLVLQIRTARRRSSARVTDRDL